MLINHETQILGIIGNPIAQSLSPLMHNAVFKQAGLNCIYLPFKISADEVKRTLEAVRILNIKGINVTIPFKEKVLDYLDELSAEAQACQAVNCIKNENGRLIGYNTDGKGFMAAIAEAEVPPGTRKAVLIGAGGAARSVAYNLANNDYKLIEILDITVEKASKLADFIEKSTSCQVRYWLMNPDNFANCCLDAQLVVNCSPVGMVPNIDKSPVDSLAAVPEGAVICDLIYNPPMTKFLHLGQARGLKTVNGVAMFVHQGALTLQILMGINPPLAFMKDVVTNQLEGKRLNIN